MHGLYHMIQILEIIVIFDYVVRFLVMVIHDNNYVHDCLLLHMSFSIFIIKSLKLFKFSKRNSCFHSLESIFLSRFLRGSIRSSSICTDQYCCRKYIRMNIYFRIYTLIHSFLFSIAHRSIFTSRLAHRLHKN